MKKSLLFVTIFLQSVLLFQMTSVFGQYGANKDCAESGCGNKSQNITRCWGSPQTFPEFPGIVVRVKGPIEHCFNAINNEPNRHSYQWWIEVKGSTNSLFRVDVTDGLGKTTNFGGNQDGVCVYPFEITQKDIQDANNSRRSANLPLDFKTFSNSERINVRLIKCTSNFKGSSNSNQTTSQQNDLSEYNRSKADLERQMQEENARRQQQANQLNNQRQNQTNTIDYSGVKQNQVNNNTAITSLELINNTVESTTNMITTTLANSMQKSSDFAKTNYLELKLVQEEFSNNNLSDKEIDSLLASADPNSYATINVYNEIRGVDMGLLINGKKFPKMDKKNNKVEYRIYNSNKLVIQMYPMGWLQNSEPIKSIIARLRKGKTYHFLMKKESMTNAVIVQIENEPLDKKGNKVYKNINQSIKSDIEY